MKGLIPFGIIVSVLYFFEDATLILLDRYTEVNIFVLFIATILFALLVAWVAKIPKVHKLFQMINNNYLKCPIFEDSR